MALTQAEKDELERLQLKAARMITGEHPGAKGLAWIAIIAIFVVMGLIYAALH